MKSRIPAFYRDLIDWSDPNDPLAKMVVPDERENQAQAYELGDPIGDHVHEPARGLIHRYPDRCLLLLTSYCGVHCRFCFRRDVVGTVLPVDVVGIQNYLTKHKEIQEVIFSGGDPGTFPPEFFKSVLKTIGKIEHIRLLRVHTRIFVVDPPAFSTQWLDAFLQNPDKTHVLVLHINHPRELTQELRGVVQALRSRGVMVLSQTVLLKDVNDNLETLSDLFSCLPTHGIKPYYLHHLDMARGTDHFRVSIEKGKRIFSSLRGKISGISLPEYVLDLPGGNGKVPVMWLRVKTPGVYEVENFRGQTVTYFDPAKEV